RPRDGAGSWPRDRGRSASPSIVRPRDPGRPVRSTVAAMTTFEVVPRGPFDLASAQDFAGGFTPGIGGGRVTGASIMMAFPVEAPGWSASAAVEVHQREDGVVVGRTDVP